MATASGHHVPSISIAHDDHKHESVTNEKASND